MKRPNGLENAPARRRPTGPSGDARTAQRQRQEPVTEPITLPEPQSPLLPPSEPSRNASGRALLREARRERRRVERGEVRRFTRRSRRRRRIILVAAAAVCALILFVVLGALSPMMALRTITVQGESTIDKAAVVKALSGQLGRPLPLVDYRALRRDLAAFPKIRSYSTESIPPNTLVVRVVERHPVGVLKTSAGYDLVDPAGIVLSTSAKAPKGYPVIVATGSSAPTANNGFSAAVAVLTALPADLGARVEEVAATTRDDVGLTLAGGIHVVWGSADQSTLKAAVLADLVAANKSRSISVYDVSSPKAAVVR